MFSVSSWRIDKAFKIWNIKLDPKGIFYVYLYTQYIQYVSRSSEETI